MASASNGDSSSLAARFDAATAVVAGHVSAITAAPAAKSRGTRIPITEHAPLWSEATLAVTTTYKGRVAKTVRVRFPSSTDVAWARTPKLEKGQKGIFFLTRDGATFTAPHPADVQPPEETQAVAALAAARGRRSGLTP